MYIFCHKRIHTIFILQHFRSLFLVHEGGPQNKFDHTNMVNGSIYFAHIITNIIC
jgi:hypothetical protein